MKITSAVRELLVQLAAIVLLSANVLAQERSIFFFDDEPIETTKRASEAEEEGAHRPPFRIGRPRYIAPLPSTQSHLESRSEFLNYNITDFLLADQDEPFVAIDPLDRNNIIAGANDYRSESVLWAYTSFDGGKTWINQALPDETTVATATDPSLAYDRAGNAYYANGGFDTFGIPYPTNEVNVFRSSDKGQTWDKPTHPFQDLTNGGANSLADKYFIAVDRDAASPFSDRIYVVWVEAVEKKTRIVSSFSTNAGSTWTPPVGITSFGDLTAPVPMTAPNGDLYIIYIDKSDAKQILVVRSVDGGQTFSAPVKVATYRDLGPVVPEGNINKRAYIKDFIGVNSFPSIAVDHSDKFKGRIYVSWAARDAQDTPHIYVSMSNDRGNTWSAPLAAEDNHSQINTDRFFNWIAVDSRNGDVGVLYYDSRIDSIDNRLVDVFFSHSRDGGTSYVSRRVSSQSFDPHVGSVGRTVGDIDFKFFGDYIGLAVLDSNWQGVWTDTRPGNDQEIFTARVQPYVPHGVEHFNVEETPDEYPRLTWEYDPQTTFGYPLGGFTFLLRRDDGEQFTIASDKREYTDESVEGGKRYTYSILVVSQGYESIERGLRYIPIRTRKPQPIEFITSNARPNGFDITFRIPDKNEVNRDLIGIDSLYVIIDNTVAEVLPLSDLYKGTSQIRTYTVSAGQYHLLEATVSTNIEGFRTFADTASVYLWSGDALQSYANDFEQSAGVFTPHAWSVTSVPPFTSNVINDSLPNVNYTAGANSWFLLPPIRINSLHRTLEYDHMALVSDLDAAAVEVSVNNGVSFETSSLYTVASRPGTWGTSLANSQMVHDRTYLQHLVDSTVIVRFRLIGSVGGMDGWFIDNVNFTDAMSVKPRISNTLSLYPNPLRAGAEARLSAEVVPGRISITIIDLLGRVVARRSVTNYASSLELPIEIDHPGSYTILLGSEDASYTVRQKVIVLP